MTPKLATSAVSSLRKAGAIANLSLWVKLPCRLQGFLDVLRSISSPWRRCRIDGTWGISSLRRLCLALLPMKTNLLQWSSTGLWTTCVDMKHSSSISLSERRCSSTIQRTGILRSIKLWRSCTTWSHLTTILRIRSSGSIRVAISSLRLSLVTETIPGLSLGLRSRHEILIISWNPLHWRGSLHWWWRSWRVKLLSWSIARLVNCLALLKFGARPTTCCKIVATSNFNKD